MQLRATFSSISCELVHTVSRMRREKAECLGMGCTCTVGAKRTDRIVVALLSFASPSVGLAVVSGSVATELLSELDDDTVEDCCCWKNANPRCNSDAMLAPPSFLFLATSFKGSSNDGSMRARDREVLLLLVPWAGSGFGGLAMPNLCKNLDRTAAEVGVPILLDTTKRLSCSASSFSLPDAYDELEKEDDDDVVVAAEASACVTSE